LVVLIIVVDRHRRKYCIKSHAYILFFAIFHGNGNVVSHVTAIFVNMSLDKTDSIFIKPTKLVSS